MPIRFACEHCESTLSVSSRKLGAVVKCPKCGARTKVSQSGDNTTTTGPALAHPASFDDDLTEPAPPPAPGATSPLAEAEPESPPAPDDGPDGVTWVYESETSEIRVVDHGTVVDFDKVALPRYVLLGQGALLVAVATFSLILGVLIGRVSGPRGEAPAGAAKPCYITGTVAYRSTSGTTSPDSGAVVFVLPQDERPPDKASIEGLRPDDPQPTDDLPALGRLKAIGGDYARVDSQGQFKLRVPDVGNYFLLVISRNANRSGRDQPDSVHLAQMGRYFTPALDLIGERRYLWQAEVVKRDRELKLVLE